MSKSVNERIVAVETKQQAMEDRMNRSDANCEKLMLGVTRAIEKVSNEEMHKLENRLNEKVDKRIKELSATKRRALGRKEWGAIILAIINGIVATLIAIIK